MTVFKVHSTCFILQSLGIWDNSLHASWKRRSWSWKGICWSRRLSWGHGSPATLVQIPFCLPFLSDPVLFWQESPPACRFTFRRSREGMKRQNVLDPQSTLCFCSGEACPSWDSNLLNSSFLVEPTFLFGSTGSHEKENCGAWGQHQEAGGWNPLDELLTEINSVMKFKHLQEGIRILVEEPESVLPLKILDTAFGLHRYCPMQENTQLREHVDAVVEQAEAGTEFGRDQVREIMNALRVSVAFVTQSFRLLRSLCSPKLHFSVQGAQEDWEPQIRWRDERYEALGCNNMQHIRISAYLFEGFVESKSGRIYICLFCLKHTLQRPWWRSMNRWSRSSKKRCWKRRQRDGKWLKEQNSAHFVHVESIAAFQKDLDSSIFIIGTFSDIQRFWRKPASRLKSRCAGKALDFWLYLRLSGFSCSCLLLMSNSVMYIYTHTLNYLGSGMVTPPGSGDQGSEMVSWWL